MPTEALTAIPQFVAIIEKLGVVGLLIIAVAWLIYERLRLVKQNSRTFIELERERLIAERYRGKLEAVKVAIPDVTDILRIYEQKLKEV